MKAKYLIKGILKSIPGIEYFYEFNKHTGGTSNARYCYSVWLRHLTYAFQNGLTSIPKTVAELGPGDSLGTGIAALFSGVEKYLALDIKYYANQRQNLKIFDEILELFALRTNIPGENEFPRLRPLLEDYSFPFHILPNSIMEETLKDKRVAKIRESLVNMNGTDFWNKNEFLQYKVPWNQAKSIEPGSVDMVFSQAVLQAVDDLRGTYMNISKWLKPGGLQSHDIGFKSCGTADTWDGHWQYSDLEWKIIRGRKNFIINREPYSTHRRLLNESRNTIIFEIKETAKSNIDTLKLSNRLKEFTQENLTTFSVFLQAKKEAH
ncbi:methyltransferase domain-containing protein [Flavitalea sp.]|nr:methyltransferase domain-containing protein [Flavitalea sp.]